VAYYPGIQPRPLFLQLVSGGPPTRIAEPNVAGPRWSPDGRLAFSHTGINNKLLMKHLDGSALEEPLGVSAPNAVVTSWSMDGKWIAYQASDNKTSTDLWLLPLQGDRKPVVFLQTPGLEASGRISPDGKWMAYAQDDAVRTEIFVQAISATGAAGGIKYRVSSAGGSEPQWRRDGRELLYISADNKVIGVPMTLGAAVEMGAPQVLFTLGPGTAFDDMTPDAQRFLINVPVGGSAHANALTVVVNWQRGMKR
jgi:Tol biopolymer transport system component